MSDEIPLPIDQPTIADVDLAIQELDADLRSVEDILKSIGRRRLALGRLRQVLWDRENPVVPLIEKVIEGLVGSRSLPPTPVSPRLPKDVDLVVAYFVELKNQPSRIGAIAAKLGWSYSRVGHILTAQVGKLFVRHKSRNGSEYSLIEVPRVAEVPELYVAQLPKVVETKKPRLVDKIQLYLELAGPSSVTMITEQIESTYHEVNQALRRNPQVFVQSGKAEFKLKVYA